VPRSNKRISISEIFDVILHPSEMTASTMFLPTNRREWTTL
jgi:hypothetical protein